MIASNLKRIRLTRGISQEQLAHESRVDRGYLWKLEQAKANPSVDLLERLADTLGVELAALFTPPDPAAPEPPPLPRTQSAKPG